MDGYTAKPFDLGAFVVLVVVVLIVLAIIWRRAWTPDDLSEPSKKPKFVSWYRAPGRDHIEYLMWLPANDFYDDPGGWIYTRVLANAHRFDTYAEAMKPTPVYDGSSDIEGRTGVFTVNG